MKKRAKRRTRKKKSAKEPTKIYQTKAKAQAGFLEVFEKTGSIRKSFEAVHRSREVVKLWRKEPDFGKRFDDTKLDIVEMLKDSAVEDALKGDSTTRNFLLKALAPEIYADRFRHEHSLGADSMGWLVSQLGELLRNYIPNLCPHCSTALNLQPRIAKQLGLLSAKIGVTQ